MALADQQIARWQKALSDFGYPYDLVSGSSADEALAAAKLVGRQHGFVPVVIAFLDAFVASRLTAAVA